MLKDLVDYLAKSLVDKPDKVSVTEVSREGALVYELRVAKEDIGKVIGKQGHTAMAIRTILNAVASKLKKRAVLEIID